MKIIFLDIDGVLNNEECLRKASRWADEAHLRLPTDKFQHEYALRKLDPNLVRVFNRIPNTTGAKIVISSTWRRDWPLETLISFLKHVGLVGEIIGKTPVSDEIVTGSKLILARERGHEIQTWLDRNPPPETFVIIDDHRKDMKHLKAFVAHTTMDYGITEADVDKAIRILSPR